MEDRARQKNKMHSMLAEIDSSSDEDERPSRPSRHPAKASSTAASTGALRPANAPAPSRMSAEERRLDAQFGAATAAAQAAESDSAAAKSTKSSTRTSAKEQMNQERLSVNPDVMRPYLQRVAAVGEMVQVSAHCAQAHGKPNSSPPTCHSRTFVTVPMNSVVLSARSVCSVPRRGSSTAKRKTDSCARPKSEAEKRPQII